ncbi:MAG: TonB-dependent receptor, partial [Bacteroidota bacterium]
MGGVINILTERPKAEKISGRASHRSATFNTQNTVVSINQAKDKLAYSIFLDRLSTDGYDIADGDEGQTIEPNFNYTFNGRVYYDFSENLSVFASGRYFLQDFDEPFGTSELRDGNAQLRIDHKLSKKSRFEYELYYTNYVTNEQTVDPIENEILLDNDFDQKLFRPEVRFNQNFGGNNTLTAGGGYNFEMLDRSLFAEEVSFDSQYVFAQYDFEPLDKVNIIVGARFDNHSIYNSQLSPKISARYAITPHFSVRGSVGSGFKAPDFRQLYLDFTNAQGGSYSVFGKEVERQGIQRLIDNDEIIRDPRTNEVILFVPLEELGEPLNAESSIGYNLGFVYKKGDFSGEVNFYRNDFRDLIDTEILATKTVGANVFGYVNRERVYTQGLEVD